MRFSSRKPRQQQEPRDLGPDFNRSPFPSAASGIFPQSSRQYCQPYLIMNHSLHPVERAMMAFNQAIFWRGRCPVWGQRMASASFDRWLYLRLHRLGFMGSHERSILQKIVLPGMTVLDVGGNLGLYTVLLSRLVGQKGRVISFEPDPDLFELLKKNCELNNCTNVEAHNLALGSRRDRLLLRKMILNSGDNTLGADSNRHFRQEIEIDVVAADEFLAELRPDLIKIDVQGWELEVLLGMRKMLAANPKAQIYFELWPAGLRRAGREPLEVAQLLQNLGFRLYHPNTGTALDENTLSLLIAQHSGMKYTDLLALHPPSKIDHARASAD